MCIVLGRYFRGTILTDTPAERIPCMCVCVCVCVYYMRLQRRASPLLRNIQCIRVNEGQTCILLAIGVQHLERPNAE